MPKQPKSATVTWRFEGIAYPEIGLPFEGGVNRDYVFPADGATLITSADANGTSAWVQYTTPDGRIKMWLEQTVGETHKSSDVFLAYPQVGNDGPYPNLELVNGTNYGGTATMRAG